jgi:hypothetical protein
MGLTNDIYEVMKTSMESDTPLDDVQDNNLYNVSEGIANAVIDFLKKQTFTITEMKSILEVEEISTTGPIQADVLPTVTTAVGGNVVQGKNGVVVPSISLKKFGGQGGAMKAVGYAYVGRNPVDSEESNEDLTKVKLLDENIIGR